MSYRRRKIRHAVLTLAMIFLGFSLMQVPKARSLELNSQMKAVSFLNDVIDLDLAAYKSSLDSYNEGDQLYPRHLSEDLQLTLHSRESKLSVAFQFIDGTFVYYLMDVLAGLPKYGAQPLSNPADMAKVILQRYQTWSEASYLETVRNILDRVDVNKNSTSSIENLTLKVSISNNYTSFLWSYTINGIVAPPKSGGLSFRNGLLTAFHDSWNVYQIGTTNVEFSRERAIEIAKDATEGYKYTIWNGSAWTEVLPQFSTSKVETTLEFINEDVQKPRGGDCLILYPCWKIILCFDKVYPGNYYGVGVVMWADTGEIENVSLAGFYGSSPVSADASSPSPTLMITLIAIPIMLTIAFGIFRRKKKSLIHMKKT